MKTTLILALLLLASPLLAQEPVPPISSLPPVVMVQVDGKSVPIQLTRVESSVRILGPIAETRMTLTFMNPHGRALEGDLYFPLPEGATISGYALDIDGSMVDGVAVTKQKARQTFEKEVRKGIDPGIVEWTRGNSFKTRIFPLPARGCRTVMVSYVSDLLATPEGAAYQLPLNFPEKVGDFSLRVEVVKSGEAPQVSGSDLTNFAFREWNQGFVAETTMKDVALTTDLLIALPPGKAHPVLVERDERGVVRFLVSERVVAPVQERTPAPKRLAVLWDASGSRGSSDQTRELKFLRSYLESALEMRPSITVSLVIFRDRAEAPREFALTAGNLDDLSALLARVPCDGGTSMGTIAPPAADLVLLFTDGLSTFGSSEPGGFEAPVYVINSSTTSDPAFMRSLARRTGGRYIDLKRTTPEQAAAAIGRPAHSFLKATADGAKLAELYPSMPEPVDGQFLLAGVLKTDAAEITLNFGVHQVTHSRTFKVSAAEAVEGDLLRRYWAQRKLGELLIAQKKNEAEITRLGKKHGLVTPFTSLIVLETLEQYLEHGILPPRTLTKIRALYIETVEHRRRKFEELERSKIEQIVALWEARVKWWEAKFTYPEDFKYRDKDLKKELESGGSEAPRTPDSAPSPAAPQGGAVPPGDNGGGRASGGFGFGAPDEEGKGDDAADGGRVGEPAIAIKGWDPKTPYLAALKAAPENERLAVYLAERKKHHASPAFFLDCADYFFKQENERIGIQILSNIAEMELENASLIRILGHRLEQLGHLDLAVLVFEEALRLRPEEPQSYRDLGLVLAKRGSRADLVRSIDLLYHVVREKWDRFEQIELLTLLELNQVIPRARAAGVTEIPVDPRLIRALDLDIRIVMTWDADLTDMDLHVIEPSGEEANYGHNRTTIGGLVSRDFTQGYGPEEYLLRRAMHGRYIIKANFYGSSAAKLIGAATLHVDVYTNYGRPNQKVQSLTFRLVGEKEMFVVGEIEF